MASNAQQAHVGAVQAPAATGAPQQNQHGPDARLAVRSPLNPDVFVFMDVPIAIHPKEMLQATSIALLALHVVQSKRKFIEYPLSALGLFGIQVLAESTKKANMSVEHRSRIIGMYTASQFLMSLELFIRENRSISVSFLKQEAIDLYRRFGAWSLHYSIEVLQSSTYPYDPERAARIGQKIEEVLVASVEESKREAERLAKAKHIRMEEQQRRAIQQEAAKIRKEEKEEEVRLQQETNETIPVMSSSPAAAQPAVSPAAEVPPATAAPTPSPASVTASPCEPIVVVLEDKTPAVVAHQEPEHVTIQEAVPPPIVVAEASPGHVTTLNDVIDVAPAEVAVETSIVQETSS